MDDLAQPVGTLLPLLISPSPHPGSRSSPRFLPNHPGDEEVPLSSTYKRMIPAMRSLHSVLRLLPCWSLCRSGAVRLGARIRQEGQGTEDPACVPLEQPFLFMSGTQEPGLQSWSLDGVEHVFGCAFSFASWA